ncbi:hypothetical protein [Nannocystis pusilla]|uniref:DUF5666 domain-containing protein n=1 Tax=Nannocystis pusilla TaxID=889268 RepID=A0ABS7U5W9_9BACT|nr:hypothetical protein [Nannocystis pusilla]MBZ5715705.1 hypothetical protein [Nannocystis pusilla]
MTSARHILGRSTAAALGVALTCGCQQDERQRTAPADPSAPQGPLPPASYPSHAPGIDRIQADPSRFYGKEVRLAGEVDELFGPRVFELEGSGWAFGDDIAVLTDTPVRFADEPLARGDVLIVDGVVHPFGAAEVERSLGRDVGGELVERLKERPVLIAASIRRLREFGPESTWYPDGRPRPVPPIRTVFTIVVADDRARLIGRDVALEREQVRSSQGRGLWIGPGPENQVFVLPASPAEGIQPGDFVQVSGTVRAMPRDARRRWGLPQREGRLLEEVVYVEAAEVRELPGEPLRPGT